MKQINKPTYKELEQDNKYWRILVTIFGISLSVCMLIGFGSFIEKNQLKLENEQLRENLGYYSGELKYYNEFVNVTCMVPREVISKNWIYQVYVITDNKTCEVLK